MEIKTNLTRVKWAGPNTPVVIICRNDARIYPSKKELVDLYNEIGEFIKFYKKDFEEPNLSYEDMPDEDMAPILWRQASES